MKIKCYFPLLTIEIMLVLDYNLPQTEKSGRIVGTEIAIVTLSPSLRRGASAS